RGAQLAVSIAISELQALINNPNDDSLFRGVDAVKRRLIARWREGVSADIVAHPLTREETSALAGHDLDQTAVYGSTLLMASVSANAGAVCQIGDGNIYVVASDGAVSTALEAHELPGEATYSLCMDNALDVMDTRFFRADELDALSSFVLCTDGYR